MGGRSGVRAASKTSIEIDFYYKGVRCKERVKLPPTPKNIKYCENWKARIDHEIAQGVFEYKDHFPNSPKLSLFATQKGDVLKLSDYLDEWLKSVKPYLKKSTWESYRKITENQLIPAFGDLNVSEIRRKHVKEWGNKKNVTAKTLGNTISPLRVALDDAVEDEIIDINPLSGWKIRRKKQAKKKDKIEPFSKDEQIEILKTASGQGKSLLQFAFWTGLRTSELCALEWNDIDWVRGVVMVTKALTQDSDEIEDTKTDAGEREVALLPMAREALVSQKKHTFLKGEEVFQNPRTGERWTGDAPIRKTLWTHILKKAGVRYRNPYQTRHTYASMLLMAGEDIRWVSNQLGHTDWTFTAKTYTRWIPKDAPNVGSKVAEWYTSGTPSDGEP